MPEDPWTDPDPQPGDFDADLAGIDPRYVDVHPGNPNAKLTIVVGIEDADAERLQLTAPGSRPLSVRRGVAAAKPRPPASEPRRKPSGDQPRQAAEQQAGQQPSPATFQGRDDSSARDDQQPRNPQQEDAQVGLHDEVAAGSKEHDPEFIATARQQRGASP